MNKSDPDRYSIINELIGATDAYAENYQQGLALGRSLDALRDGIMDGGFTKDEATDIVLIMLQKG